MANWTLEPTTEISFPHLTVFRKRRDGVPVAWLLRADDGYVMHDPADRRVYTHPDTGVQTEEMYYFKEMHCPPEFDFAQFTAVAVREEDIDGK